MIKYVNDLLDELEILFQNSDSDTIASKLIEWNKQYLKKNHINEEVSTNLSKLVNTDNFKIAFRLNGNLGSILVRINMLKKIVSLMQRRKIDVTVYGHPREEINQEIFNDLDFIDHIRNYSDLKGNEKKHHLVIDLDTFPTVLYQNTDEISSKAPIYLPMLKCWREFKEQHKKWFEKVSDFRPQIYTLAIMNGKNCINNIDVHNYLGLENHFIYSIKPNNVKEVLRRFHLKEKFITFNRGSYTIANQSEGTRVWPLDYYNQLVSLLKKNYPNVKLVQLGENAECLPIEGIDINLCGKTTLPELKVLLSKAFLHIDGEGGMVHLRKALNGGISVVLFGSTPLKYFGYDDNINLSSECCSESCCELHKNWLHKCLLTDGEALCLKRIKPKSVFKCVSEYLDNKFNIPESNNFEGLYKGTYEFLHDKTFILDKTWSDEFVRPRNIYNYFKEKVKVGNLFCKYYTQKKIWETRPISESNCLTFLKGNKKAYEKYNKFKNDTYAKDSIHSSIRFQRLINELNKKKYNSKYPIIIDGHNVIMDGQHRACWLLNKYGPDYEITVVKIYGDWRM